MMMVADDPTLPPRYIVEHFRKAYHGVHKRDPMVRYMGNHWYYVNGETVHRGTLGEDMGAGSLSSEAPQSGMDQSILRTGKTYCRLQIEVVKKSVIRTSTIAQMH